MSLVHVTRMTLFAFVLSTFAGSSLLAEDAEAVKWHHSISEAKKIAQETGRPLLIFVTMQNCRYCTQMKQTTLVDPTVVEEANESFVSAYVDESTNRELVRSLGIRSFPTTLIATPDGRVKEMVRGFVGAEALKQRMRSVRVADRG